MAVFEVQFIGEVDRILDPADDDIPDLEHTEGTGYDQPGRKLITFKDGRLWRLSEPITFGISGLQVKPRRTYSSINFLSSLIQRLWTIFAPKFLVVSQLYRHIIAEER